MNKVPMTEKGEIMLREELKRLKSSDRPRVIKAIAVARAHGDLRENAEYHAARDEQSFIEGRLAEIEGKLSNAQVIDVTKVNANGKVVFGATIDLTDEETGEEMTYQIVGEDEANIQEKKISYNSPIARGLLGKEEGDVAKIEAPRGIKMFEILAVRYV